MEKDKLVECNRCGGNACYEQHIGTDVTTWFCVGCGFTSSTLMDKGGKVAETLKSSSPELYRDLMFEDVNGRVWAPATVTVPNKGMVFLDGTSKQDWQWSAVNSIAITEEDRKSKKFPIDQQMKMDMKNMKKFSQRDFIDALEYINFFKED